jgi:kynureninase
VSADDPLLRFRAEFPILESCTYLVSNSLGAMPRTVPDRLAEYARQWATKGVKAWSEGWWEMPVAAGSVIAPLIGAKEGEVVMMPNVTLAQSVVLSALDFSSGRDTVVMTALDFPSVQYAYAALARRFGARVVTVPSSDGLSIDTDRILAEIDARTRLVSVSHVLFRSAYILEVEAICRRAHEVGALVCLDAFHSVGIIPVDVRAIGVDFLTGGVLKWLCGGPGGCFLYVSPALRDQLSPALTGWQAHARPFAFDLEMELAESPFRWLNGTPGIPALYAATEGPRIVREADVNAIRSKSSRQTAWLVETADKRGYRVHAPRDPERRGGTVAFDIPHSYEVSRYLLAHDIVIDWRAGAGIRVAPHFYTSDAELDHVVDGIDEALRTEDWMKFTDRSSVVT